VCGVCVWCVCVFVVCVCFWGEGVLVCSVRIATNLRTVGKEEGVSISGMARDVSSHL